MSQQQPQQPLLQPLSTSTTTTFVSTKNPNPNLNNPNIADNEESMQLMQQQMKYVAYQQHRSAPPRCHPISIYILVQSLGCVLTGLTMIITAHWPGTGSKSSDVLKIVGPILIALGVILFVIGVLLARFLRKKDVKKWNMKVSQIVQSASRQVLDQQKQQQQQQPTSSGQLHYSTGSPNRSQLQKQVPKTSLGFGSDEERKELLSSPESEDRKTFGGKMAAAVSSSESDVVFNAVGGNEDVPEAVRLMKKRAKKKPGDVSSSFENLQPVEEEMGKDQSQIAPQGQTRGSRDDIHKRRDIETIEGNEEEEEDEYLTGRRRIVTKTTTVVKTTTTKTKPEIKSKPDVKPPPFPDSPRLRVKIKASPGTSVNIRHSGSESEDGQQSKQQQQQQQQKAKVQSKPKPKPKPKPKKPNKDNDDDEAGTDV